MSMESAIRMLEISAISADDLENVRTLGRRMRTYAVVSADDDLSQRVSTGVDEEGGCDPVWNDKLQLRVSKLGSNMALNIQVFCKTTRGQKSVGWSRVPLSDIFNGFGHPQNAMNCLSYRLKTKEGRPHGTINFSLRFLQHVNPPQFFTTLPQQGRYQNTPESASLSGVTMGYPPFSSPSPSAYANANYQLYSNTPLSVYPPPHHKQMYA